MRMLCKVLGKVLRKMLSEVLRIWRVVHHQKLPHACWPLVLVFAVMLYQSHHFSRLAELRERQHDVQQNAAGKQACDDAGDDMRADIIHAGNLRKNLIVAFVPLMCH